MKSCWKWDASDRPHFWEIHATLVSLMQPVQYYEDDDMMDPPTIPSFPLDSAGGGLIDASQQSSVFLSTFTGSQGGAMNHVGSGSGGGGSGGAPIMRRNKKGKQAPAPPKRTSSFRDSQCDLDPDSQSYGLEDSTELQYIRRRENASFEKLADLTDADYADLSGADADEDSEVSDTAQSVPEMKTSTRDSHFRDRSSSRGKGGAKSRTYPIKDHLGMNKLSHNHSSKPQVVALEEVNVRKAINRYGTLPKGARIGAYLDSMRQDPLTGGGEAPADYTGEGGGGEAQENLLLRKSNLASQGKSTKPVKQVMSSPGRTKSNKTSSPRARHKSPLESGLGKPLVSNIHMSCLQSSKSTSNSPVLENNPLLSTSASSLKEALELKLISEIKESSNSKINKKPLSQIASSNANGIASSQGKDLSNIINNVNSNNAMDKDIPSNSPALQLVSEIFESLKVKNVHHQQQQKNSNNEYIADNNDDMRSSLPLTKATSLDVGPQQPHENIENFKSRLRKVSKSLDGGNAIESNSTPPPPIPQSVSEAEEQQTEQNGKEKRSSTGSITSLKKMWEGQQQQGAKGSATEPPKQQPKNSTKDNINDGLSSKNKPASATGVIADSKSKSSSTDKSSTVDKEKPLQHSKNKTDREVDDKQSANSTKTDGSKVTRVKRVWPPVPSSENDHHKPAIPSKPITAKKPANPIYATPSQRQDYSSRSKSLV